MITTNNNDFILPASLSKVKELVDEGKVTISFWGQRIVTFTNHSISVNELAQKVLTMAKGFSEADNLTIDERVIGLDMTNQLRSFYKVDTSNWFSSVLNKIRECRFFNLYGPKFTRLEHYFRRYSDTKIAQDFKFDRNDVKENAKFSDGFSGKWTLIREKILRQK